MKRSPQFWLYTGWVVVLCLLAGMHYLHLSADFPNHSPWMSDWAKYTDEGWYGNAAIRQHLFGRWYLPGDFNPAPAVPVWPLLEWLVFCITGVSLVAARALSVTFFIVDVLLAYLLIRVRHPLWVGLLAATLCLSSPFLYAFSRLAILEPLLMAFLLAALNLAVRLPRFKKPTPLSALIGVLFTLMLLTKTSAAFLLPALGWVLLGSFWSRRLVAFRCALAAGATAALTFAGWMLLIIRLGLLPDYRYLFFINKYVKPSEFYWPVLSLGWSLGGSMWADRTLLPLAAFLLILGVVTLRSSWSCTLRRDPVFMASALAGLGYILFMTYQNHPQPRYYTVVALFAFIVVAIACGALVSGWQNPGRSPYQFVGIAVLGCSAFAIGANTWQTAAYATHPEYTFVTAARELTRYIDQHPSGNRLVVSISGDQLTLMTHLPSICDDFGTEDLPEKLARYQPGWWATWNDIDVGTLEDLHVHYSLEQVGSFQAFDDPDRNVLVLFKLIPLPSGKDRQPVGDDLQKPLPDDEIDIPVE